MVCLLAAALATTMVNEGWANQAQSEFAGNSGEHPMLISQPIPEEEEDDSDDEDDQVGSRK